MQDGRSPIVGWILRLYMPLPHGARGFLLRALAVAAKIGPESTQLSHRGERTSGIGASIAELRSEQLVAHASTGLTDATASAACGTRREAQQALSCSIPGCRRHRAQRARFALATREPERALQLLPEALRTLATRPMAGTTSSSSATCCKPSPAEPEPRKRRR